MGRYQEYLSQLFRAFVKSADARNDVLKWIGDCLFQNRGILFPASLQLKLDFLLGKNKEWASHNPLTAYVYASDGFLLNLNIVLLNLAGPFCEPYSPKLLKINLMP